MEFEPEKVQPGHSAPPPCSFYTWTGEDYKDQMT